MTKEQVEKLLYTRDQELEELKRVQSYIDGEHFQEVQRANAEGYKEAMKDILDLLRAFAKGEENETD